MSAGSGTVVAFLFTDIEGSAAFWERHPAAMRAAAARYDSLLRAAIAAHSGVAYKVDGEAFQVAFPSAAGAVAAALAAQRSLAADSGSLSTSVRPRMALHAGQVEPTPDGDYRSPVLNRLGRLLAAGHGDQILLSAAIADLARGDLPAEARLRDLGERQLRGLQDSERVYQLVAPGLPTTFPPLRTLDARPANLPTEPTRLIGRDAEVAAVRRLIEEEHARLVTLTGPGGVGKTRLALRAATELVDGFRDGAWFVDLVGLSDPALLALAIAARLEVREEPGRPLADTLAAALQQRELLLVLDNFEQVLTSAQLVADLLAAAPRLTVLVTSRIRLRLPAETPVAVPPLALPAAAADTDLGTVAAAPAAALFLDRAAAVHQGQALTDDDAPAIAAVCALLDGLPLAIELAAARSDRLTPANLRDQFERRLSILTDGPRDLPARQQAMRAAIAWSHDLLTDPERAVFRRLSVCVGGCDPETASAIATVAGDLGDAPLALATRLADHHLLRWDASAAPTDRDAAKAPNPRLTMLETIREYGLEQLEASGEEPVTRAAHAAHFLALAKTTKPLIVNPESRNWLDRLDLEHPNLRGALGWAIDRGEIETALDFASALTAFWDIRGHHSEQRGWIERMLAQPGSIAPAARATALNDLGVVAYRQGDHRLSRRSLEESLAIRRTLADRPAIASTLNNLGLVARAEGDLAHAHACYDESLSIRRELGDRRWEALTLSNLGIVAAMEEDLPAAETNFEAARAVLSEIGDSEGVANALLNLGKVAEMRDDLERAQATFAESLTHGRALGHKIGIANALEGLGHVARRRGEHARATECLDEALVLRRALGNAGSIADVLYDLGIGAEDQGDLAAAWARHRECLAIARDHGPESMMAPLLEAIAGLFGRAGQATMGARLLGTAAVLREAHGAPTIPSDRQRHERRIASVRDRLPSAAFTAAWDAGRAQPTAAAVAEALASTVPAAPTAAADVAR